MKSEFFLRNIKRTVNTSPEKGKRDKDNKI